MGTLRRLVVTLPWLFPAVAAAMERSGPSAAGAGPAGPQSIALQAATGLAAVALLIVLFAVIKSRGGRVPGQEVGEGGRPGSFSWTFVPLVLLLTTLFLGGNTGRMLSVFRAMGAEPPIQVKVTGHRGWWEYEYLGTGVRLESRPGDSCSCAVDAPLVLPAGREVRFLGTSADIPLSFDLPALGLHNDLIPGYTTDAWATPAKEGTLLGGCGRRCGARPRAPVVVKVVSAREFEAWIARPSATNGVGGTGSDTQ
jgi:heme/copper-type cytochrome/quinol oxidase subunit 2